MRRLVCWTVTAWTALLMMAPAWAGARQGPSAGAASAEHAAAIRELLELTGAAALADQVVGQMIGPMRQALPQVPAEFWQRLAAELDTNELVEMTVPVYAKHLSLEEVRELNAFYRSPVGRKLVAVQPAILQESMQLGMRWGAEKGQLIEQRLREEGYRPQP